MTNDGRISEIDTVVRSSIIEFGRFVRDQKWKGKEHDCVNVYAHSYLAKEIRPNTVLFDLGQIRIEGGVPQPAEAARNPKSAKRSARKDLVIWPKPLDVCWDQQADHWEPIHPPLAILEWKADLFGFGAFRFDPHDIQWLGVVSKSWENFVGYEILLHREGLRVARFAKDEQALDWVTSADV